MRIQIYDQGREFVNEVSDHLHHVMGVYQIITSANHPQSKRLCERQNRTIKDSLIKVLEEKVDQWPYIIDGVLSAHRISKHTVTEYSSFFLLHKRDLTFLVI